MAKTPSSASELFNEMIPNGLQKNPAKAKEVGAVYMFRIQGEGGGDWVVDLSGDPPTCKPGTTDSAQCTIEVDHSDFKRMMAEPQAGMELYFSGKLKVSGDPMLATRLQQFFRLAA
ncbi:MAG: SCP2 sterol-binding domain-containing protein [Kofleriaceae bacterium]